jgi:ABC-type antimicrobial peptide transport system permease subunit
MAERANVAGSARRFVAGVQSAFALLGLILAAIGVYGVATLTVQRRRREMGVRIAMGATPWQVFLGVQREGAQLTLIGLALGALLSLALTRGMRSLLFAVEPADALTFTAMATLVAAVATTAFAWPAWRATRIEPTEAIRAE